MAFCSFSKDCEDNSYVTVENKFITKYLPEADGFAVKVYLYGLYLCKNAVSDFSLASMAEVLKTSEEKIVEAFAFWEDYDLVAIVSKEPFAVQYLPVKAAIGRPKRCATNSIPISTRSYNANSNAWGNFCCPAII